MDGPVTVCNSFPETIYKTAINNEKKIYSHSTKQQNLHEYISANIHYRV